MRGGVSGRISRGTRVRGRGISTSNHSRNSPASSRSRPRPSFIDEDNDNADDPSPESGDQSAPIEVNDSDLEEGLVPGPGHEHTSSESRTDHVEQVQTPSTSSQNESQAI